MAIGAAAARSKANKRKGPPVSSSRDRARIEANRQRKQVGAAVLCLGGRQDWCCVLSQKVHREVCADAVRDCCAQEEAKIKALFETKDADRSGGLDAPQMKSFMQEYIKTTDGNAEKLVSDAEVKCVSSTALSRVRH